MTGSTYFLHFLGALFPSLLLFSACGGDNASFSYTLERTDSVKVDESSTVITRKPTAFNVLNDSLLISVINSRKMVTYNYRSGEVVREFRHKEIPEDSLYRDVALYRQNMLDKAGLKGTYIPDLDSVKKMMRNKGKPYFILYPRLWYDRDTRELYGLYKLTVINSQDHPERDIIHQENQFYILKLTKDLQLKDIMAGDRSASDLKDYNKPFFWPFFGFTAKDSSLTTFVNAEGPLDMTSGRILAQFVHREDTGQYIRDHFLDITLNENRINAIDSRFEIFRNTHFTSHNGERYWSEGKKIYSLDAGKVVYDGILKRTDKTVNIYNFHWSPEHENLLYYTLLKDDTTKEKGKTFSLQIRDTTRKKPRELLTLNPYKTKLAFFRDGLVLFTKGEKHYTFRSYEWVEGP